ncbi:microfibril-associated glycoprotein 4-like [Anopheles marshallii]|uniref:microfibril-associated glycoprotein 4-like n=1 Tax=Anopheles marshallii TaxID=1521116 RepID=UPI00237BE310|nr:microfibril-associated glycoprotein 4-like [Anopheles marshallii]
MPPPQYEHACFWFLSTLGCKRHCYRFSSVYNIFKINLPCALTLCCTLISAQCNPTENTACVVQGGFDLKTIINMLHALEECNTEKEKQMIKRSCSEVPTSGIYTIQPEKPFYEPITVLCDQDHETGGWIVIQHRFNGTMNFYRNWKQYKHGFGNLDGEFWLGLDRIYQLTVSRPHELVVLLEDFEGNKRYAKYDQFEIGDETEMYILKELGNYSGTAGDSLRFSNAAKFSTFDVDNDTGDNSCAVQFTGAWWYNSCHYINLNGKYLRGNTTKYAAGMVWVTFRGYNYALKSSKMMIRRNRSICFWAHFKLQHIVTIAVPVSEAATIWYPKADSIF